MRLPFLFIQLKVAEGLIYYLFITYHLTPSATPIHHLFPPLTDSTLLDPYRHSHFAKDIGIKVANLILR